MELLKRGDQFPGISGYEGRVGEKLIEWIEPFANYKVDGIGNLIVL